MRRPFLRTSKKRGFELVIRDVPKWAVATEKALDLTVHKVCCSMPTYHLTRLLHAPLNALPDGEEVEVHSLDPSTAYFITLALELDPDMSWAMTVSIMYEEAVEESRHGDAQDLLELLQERGYDEEGERV